MARVVIRDHGFAVRIERIRGLQGGVVVGVPSTPREDGTDMAEVAMANEFGTDSIPARPFLRPAFDSHHAELARRQSQLAKKVLAGDITSEEAFAKLGERGVELVRRQIEATYRPPNAPSTIARKGSDHPLIDTRQMIDSVTYAVHPGAKPPEEG